MALGDSMNMVETPEDSPERSNDQRTGTADREAGGRFIHMAQDHEALSRSVHALQMERHTSDMMALSQPKVVEIELGYEERKR